MGSLAGVERALLRAYSQRHAPAGKSARSTKVAEDLGIHASLP